MQKQIFLLVCFGFTISSFAQDTLQTVKIENQTRSLKRASNLTTNTTLITSKELLELRGVSDPSLVPDFYK